MTTRRNLFALGFAGLVSALLPVAKASPKQFKHVPGAMQASQSQVKPNWKPMNTVGERLDKDGIYWLNHEGEVHYIEPNPEWEHIREDMRRHGRIVEYSEEAINRANAHVNPLNALRQIGTQTATA